MNTTDFLTIAAAICPDRDAIVFEGKRRTYSEISERVNKLSNALAGLGVKSGDRVAIMQVNCPEYIETSVLWSYSFSVTTVPPTRGATPAP